MGVRFAADVRRAIVSAQILGEARGHSRPVMRDLADTLVQEGVTLPPLPLDRLPEDLETVLMMASGIAGDAELTMAMLLEAMKGKAPAAWQSVRATPAPSEAVRIATTRSGIGYDSHRFAPGGPLLLGGVRIESEVHCVGHSDADAVCHAITDAILGAAGAGDIGALFPDTDPANKGRDSIEMLRTALARVHSAGYSVVNVDVTVILERPRIAPHRDAIRATLATVLDVGIDAVSVKGKTNEGLGWIGRGEGLGVIAVATLAHGAS